MSNAKVSLAPDKLTKLANQFSLLSWDDQDKLKKQARALYDERCRKAAEKDKKKIPTHAKGLFIYKLWYTGNGGIPSDVKYSYFISKPSDDDLYEAACSHFGGPDSHSSGFRGFQWQKVPFKNFRKLADRHSELDTIARKATEKAKQVRQLVDFYLRIKDAGFDLH